MSGINYRNIAIRELKDFSEQFSDYTLGEILYAVIRGKVTDPAAIKELRNLSDEQIYTMIEKAREAEAE